MVSSVGSVPAGSTRRLGQFSRRKQEAASPRRSMGARTQPRSAELHRCAAKQVAQTQGRLASQDGTRQCGCVHPLLTGAVPPRLVTTVDGEPSLKQRLHFLEVAARAVGTQNRDC